MKTKLIVLLFTTAVICLYSNISYTQDKPENHFYEMNFLTAPQLTKKVNGVPLRKWIEKDSKHGILSPFAGGMKLWEVQKSQIPRVRRILHDAGAIYDWRHDRDDTAS